MDRYPSRSRQDEIATEAIKALRGREVIVYWDEYKSLNQEKVNQGKPVRFGTRVGTLTGLSATPPLHGNSSSTVNVMVQDVSGVMWCIPASRLIRIEKA